MSMVFASPVFCVPTKSHFSLVVAFPASILQRGPRYPCAHGAQSGSPVFIQSSLHWLPHPKVMLSPNGNTFVGAAIAHVRKEPVKSKDRDILSNLPTAYSERHSPC